MIRPIILTLVGVIAWLALFFIPTCVFMVAWGATNLSQNIQATTLGVLLAGIPISGLIGLVSSLTTNRNAQ